MIALDARTGKRVWHFQTVKHDLWDMDLPSPPTLVTVRRDGKTVDAVAQITKTGFVFVFDRKTREAAVPDRVSQGPASTLDGERASTTQPVPRQAAAVRSADADRGDADERARPRRTRRR